MRVRTLRVSEKVHTDHIFKWDFRAGFFGLRGLHNRVCGWVGEGVRERHCGMTQLPPPRQELLVTFSPLGEGPPGWGQRSLLGMQRQMGSWTCQAACASPPVQSRLLFRSLFFSWRLTSLFPCAFHPTSAPGVCSVQPQGQG